MRRFLNESPRARYRRNRHVMEAEDVDFETGRPLSPRRTPSPRVVTRPLLVSAEQESESDMESLPTRIPNGRCTRLCRERFGAFRCCSCKIKFMEDDAIVKRGTSNEHLACYLQRMGIDVDKFEPPSCTVCFEFIASEADIVRCATCNKVEHLDCYLKRSGTDNCWVSSDFQESRQTKCQGCFLVAFF
jgi:hypothetical protein